MRKPYGFAFGAILVASVVFLSAQVSGFPSRPRLQAVTVGSGTLATTGQMRTSAVTPIISDAADVRWCLNETDGAATNQAWIIQAVNEGFRLRTAADGCSIVGAATPIQVDRTGQNVDSIALTADAVTVNGDTVATRASGTYTATATGCTTAPTATVHYQVVDNWVSLTMEPLTCTSNTTAFTATGAPADLIPNLNSGRMVLPNITNNSVSEVATGNVLMNSSGALVFSRNGSATGFTNSGTKGVTPRFNFTYSLVNLSP